MTNDKVQMSLTNLRINRLIANSSFSKRIFKELLFFTISTGCADSFGALLKLTLFNLQGAFVFFFKDIS